jgi:glutamate synthase (NADPH/NADH) large chain
MSGGMAYVWDPEDRLEQRINGEMVGWQRLEVPLYVDELRSLLREYHAATQSPLAERILREFDRELPRFWQVVPKEMLDRLEVPVRAEPAESLRA